MLYISIDIYIYIDYYLPVDATVVVTGASARTVSKTPSEIDCTLLFFNIIHLF